MSCPRAAANSTGRSVRSAAAAALPLLLAVLALLLAAPWPASAQQQPALVATSNLTCGGANAVLVGSYRPVNLSEPQETEAVAYLASLALEDFLFTASNASLSRASPAGAPAAAAAAAATASAPAPAGAAKTGNVSAASLACGDLVNVPVRVLAACRQLVNGLNYQIDFTANLSCCCSGLAASRPLPLRALVYSPFQAGSSPVVSSVVVANSSEISFAPAPAPAAAGRKLLLLP